jgi:hypothetical protein
MNGWPQNSSLFCFVLFCFVLFCFVLFCFVLFCFVLFCLKFSERQAKLRKVFLGQGKEGGASAFLSQEILEDGMTTV